MTELARLRLSRGLTREELADSSGVSVTTVAELEQGKRPRPQPRTLRKLADALDIEISELLEALESPKAQSPLPLFEGAQERARAERRSVHLLLAAWQEYLLLPLMGRAEALKEAFRFRGLRELDEQEAATRIRITFAQTEQFISDVERLSVIDRTYLAELSQDAEQKLGPEGAEELASIRQTIAGLRTKSDRLAERVEKIRQRTRDQGFAREQVDAVFAELEAVNQE